MTDTQIGSLSQNPIALLKPSVSFEATAGSLNYTTSLTMRSPVPFYGFRVHFFNTASNDVINCTAGAAASRNMTGGVFAATETPVQITVGSNAAFTKPAALSGGGTGQAIWTDTVSDWVPCVSVPRDDGGAGYLLMVRAFEPSAGNATGNRCGGHGITPADVDAYGCATVLSGGGDKTFTNWATFAILLNGLGSAIAVELLSASNSLTLATFGDSTIAGQNAAVIGASGAQLAATGYSSGSRPLVLWNQGESSMNSTTYLALAEKFFATGAQPNIAAMCPYSSNDTDKYTQAGINRIVGVALRFLNECRKAGAIPILLTPVPYTGTTSGEEAFRRQAVVAIKQLAVTYKCGLVDRDSIYTDYSTAAGGWLPVVIGDGTHPSHAGYVAESALWTAALAPYF